MISYETFRDIQNEPQFWGFKGIYLWTFFIVTVIVLIIATVTSAWMVKIITILTGIICSFVLRYYSKELGVRGIKKVIGRLKQPSLIISVSPQFYLPEKRTTENETIQTQ